MTDPQIIDLHNPQSQNFKAFIYANSLTCEAVCEPSTAKGQHVVICGAGPSLADNIEYLKDADQIWGCNSALTWLHDNGHNPTHGFCIDQTSQMLGEWFDAPDVEYLLASTCHPHLVNFLQSKGRRTKIFHNFVGIPGPGVAQCECGHELADHEGTPQGEPVVISDYWAGVYQRIDDDEWHGLLADPVVLALAKDVLPSRDLAVLVAYFEDGKTLAAIGEEHGISASRVTQLRDRAKRVFRFDAVWGRAFVMPKTVSADHDDGCYKCECEGYTEVVMSYESWMYSLLYDTTVMLGSGLNSVTRAIDLANFFLADKITVLGADCALKTKSPRPKGADFGTELHKKWLQEETIMHADGGNALASDASSLTFTGQIDGRWWETKPDLVISAVWLTKMARVYPHLHLIGDTLPNALKDKPDEFLSQLPTLRDSNGDELKFEVAEVIDYTKVLP